MNSKVRHNERNLVEDAYGRLDELVVEDLEMQFEAGAVRGVIPGREALVRSGQSGRDHYNQHGYGKREAMDNQVQNTQDPSQEQTAPRLQDLLPEELRAESALANFESVDKLAKGYLYTKRALSGKVDEFVKQAGFVRVPGEDADEATVAQFYKQLGVPEDENGYESPDLPEGFGRDDILDREFKKMALASRLSPGQFKDLYAGFLAYQQANVSAVQEQTKALFGEQYEAAVRQAQNGLSRLPEALQAQVKPFVGFDPILTQVLNHVGGLFQEGQQPGGGAAAQTNTVESLTQQMNEIMQSEEYKRGSLKLSAKVMDLRAQRRKLLKA